MSAVDAVVFRGFMQTILITRGVPPKGGHFRPAGGGEVRAALTSHLAEDAGAVMDLATFWVDSGGRPVSVLLQAELIAEVAAAVAAGRLWAFVFREPAYVSAADHQALIKAAELAARAGPGLRSGNAYGLLPPEMGVADKFSSVFHRAVPLVGPELRAQLLAVVEDPANLAIALATLVILAQLHAVAAGEAIDAVVLSAIVACAVLRGVGLFQAISAALDAVIHLVAFIIQTAAAKEEKDLDAAAARLAAGLSSIGVSALMLALSWISGRFSDSLKKTGGKKGVGKVSKEEMAGKNKKEPPPALLPPKTPSNPVSSAAEDRRRITELANNGDLEGARAILRPHLERGDIDGIIERLDVSVGKNQGVLWSGNKQGAAMAAGMQGKTTLEMTPGGKVVDEWPELSRVLNWESQSGTVSKGEKFWGGLSSKYASGLEGDVDVLLTSDRPKGGFIFNKYEIPAIKSGGMDVNINMKNNALQIPLQLEAPKVKP
ncbi:hypothetical protein ACI7BZ_06160 [Xanthobacter sp. AM11]|uniref:hypothetical protein n=1 Tax=Xanthobacter sp. AM11 TaxID=3380643 RepID=UPI0039C000E4